MNTVRLNDHEKSILKRLLSNEDFLFFLKKIIMSYEVLKDDMVLNVGSTRDIDMFNRGYGRALKNVIDTVNLLKEKL